MVEASKKDSEAFARALDDGKLTCRGLSHSKAWSYVSVVQLEGYGRKEFWEQHVVCRNGCGVTWSVIYDKKSGAIVKRIGPKYPKPKDDEVGYLAKGIGRINKDVVRREALMRNFIEPKEESA
jgi:hypothetical protein